jgi:hemoglobin-like flavoprotein
MQEMHFCFLSNYKNNKMTQKQIELVKSTWALVSTIDPLVVGGLFYNRLFEKEPGVKSMFRESIAERSKTLIATLSYIVAKLDKLEDIMSEVRKLARRHTDYGVKPEHYIIAGDILMWTLEQGLGENWNQEVKEAWIECYTIISNAMIASSGQEIHKAA